MELPSKLQQRLQSALGDTYRVLRELGGGGMSRVFLAEEVRLGRQVVVKVLPPETGAAVNVERFEREIQLAARLQHPHIVPLLSAAAAGELLYYVMPYIQGESLRSRLGREGELPVAEATRILREIVDALSYAHRNGVVHRDIKPDNVLLSDGHAVVTDFGVAKAVTASGDSSGLTSVGVALGTPAYMAPEQAAADPHVDHRADIYAAGLLGYEMLTGRTPFAAATPQAMLAAHITQAPNPVAKIRPAVSPGLNAALMRCLEKRAADRWQSAAELLAQLEAAATPSGGLAPTHATRAIASGTPAARGFHPARVALLFAAASAGVLGAVYLLVHRLGLPDWVLTGAVVLLLIGLPIMLVAGHIERRRAMARAGGGVATTAMTGLHGWLTWRKAIQGGMLAFAALGIATVAYTVMRLLGIGPVGTLVASGRLSERDRLIVADFENRTADSGLGASVTEALRIDLAQTPVVRILSTAEVGDALARMRRDAALPVTPELAREIAAREGAKAVVTGEISALGKSYVVSARIVSAADGAELLALRETAENDAAIVAALDRLSARVRERIGESLVSIRAGQPLEQVTTGSLEALRLYSEGAKLSDQGMEVEAVDWLEQAIELDSGFAMAWRKLAVALDNSRASQERVVLAATRAYQHRERLTEIERQLATAYYHNRVDFDIGKEEAAYRRVLAMQRGNPVASNNLSLLLSETGRGAEAESLIVPAIRAGSEPGNLMLQLMVAQVVQGHDAQVRRTLDSMARIAPDLGMYVWARGLALTALGDYAGAERAFLELERKSGERDLTGLSEAYQGLARLARIRGRLDEADRHTREDMEVSGRRRLPGTVLADATDLAMAHVVFRGDSTGGVAILEAALRENPLDSLPPLDRPGAQVALVYALAGRREQARRTLVAYESQVPEGSRRGHWAWYQARGWLALADGRSRDGLAAFVEGRVTRRCAWCNGWEEGVAYERVGLPDSALAAYERAVGRGAPLKALVDQWSLGPSLKRLGELYEARGDPQRALEHYGRFVGLWKEADPVLQPVVREVRGRIAALAGEPQPVTPTAGSSPSPR